MGQSQRDRLRVLRELIRELQGGSNGAAIIEDILERAKELGIQKDNVEDMLQKLKSAGDVVESSNNRYRVV